jgi:hypothetical protein
LPGPQRADRQDGSWGVGAKDVWLELLEGVAEDYVRLGNSGSRGGGEVVEDHALGIAVAYVVPG